jgi:hypothetical protein
MDNCQKENTHALKKSSDNSCSLKREVNNRKNNLWYCCACFLIKGLEVCYYAFVAFYTWHYVFPPEGLYWVLRITVIWMSIEASYAALIGDLCKERFFGGGLTWLLLTELYYSWFASRAHYSWLDRLLE